MTETFLLLLCNFLFESIVALLFWITEKMFTILKYSVFCIICHDAQASISLQRKLEQKVSKEVYSGASKKSLRKNHALLIRWHKSL